MKRTIFLALFILLRFIAAAQGTNETQINAFSESYKSEYAKDYDKAINALKEVYIDSYEMNLRLGWLYYSKKDYPQSLKYYQSALRLKPRSIEALLGSVNPEAALQNWTNVFAIYQKILAIDPNNSIANYRMALMYYYRKDYANAQLVLQKVLDLYPFDYDSMLLMAQTKIAAGKLAEGKSWYEKVVLYNPSDSAMRQILEKL